MGRIDFMNAKKNNEISSTYRSPRVIKYKPSKIRKLSPGYYLLHGEPIHILYLTKVGDTKAYRLDCKILHNIDAYFTGGGDFFSSKGKYYVRFGTVEHYVSKISEIDYVKLVIDR